MKTCVLSEKSLLRRKSFRSKLFFYSVKIDSYRWRRTRGNHPASVTRYCWKETTQFCPNSVQKCEEKMGNELGSKNFTQKRWKKINKIYAGHCRIMCWRPVFTSPTGAKFYPPSQGWSWPPGVKPLCLPLHSSKHKRVFTKGWTKEVKHSLEAKVHPWGQVHP
jgi:hypothetical protein